MKQHRTFLQIMREAYRARRAGVSAFVALSMVMQDDDDCEVVWQRLMKAARLDRATQKYRPDQHR